MLWILNITIFESWFHMIYD